MHQASPFAFDAFRALWLSNLASNTGILIQSVGASWVMVEAGANPQFVALVQTAASLPLVLFSPVSGAISDRMDRRRVMIAAQAALVAVSVALALLSWAGLASPWLVLACTFLVGSCLACNGPAWMASVGDILPRAAIPAAVVYNAIGLNVARSVGPALGGAIVAGAGATASFVVNAVSSLGLIAVLLRWHRDSVRPPTVSGPLSAAIIEGMRYAGNAPPIRAALLRALLFGAVASAAQALMPLVARDVLDGGSTVFGFLFGGFGVGALVGALLSNRLRKRLRPEAVVQLCSLVSALATVGVAWSVSIVLTILFLALCGAAWVVAFSTFNVAVQLSSPRWVVARTLSLYQMAVFSGVAVGSWISGLVADHIGTSGSLLVAGMCIVFSLAGALVAPLRQVEEAEAQ